MASYKRPRLLAHGIDHVPKAATILEDQILPNCAPVLLCNMSIVIGKVLPILPIKNAFTRQRYWCYWLSSPYKFSAIALKLDLSFVC